MNVSGFIADEWDCVLGYFFGLRYIDVVTAGHKLIGQKDGKVNLLANRTRADVSPPPRAVCPDGVGEAGIGGFPSVMDGANLDNRSCGTRGSSTTSPKVGCEGYELARDGSEVGHPHVHGGGVSVKVSPRQRRAKQAQWTRARYTPPFAYVAAY